MNIKPLRRRLDEISKKNALRLDVIQQDYLLSWVLVGIFQHPYLKSHLIFKGGTALKKDILVNIDFLKILILR